VRASILTYLLIASVVVGLTSLAAASVDQKTVESRDLRRRLGLSEEEIVRLLAPTPAGPGFEARVEDWVQASFARSKRKLFLVAVSGNLGSIPSWPFVEVGIIDPGERRVVSKCEFNQGGFSQLELGPRGLRPQPSLKVLDGAFSFQTTTDRLDAGLFLVQEHWFLPKLTSTGDLTCPEIWAIPMFFSYFGNRGGFRTYGCSSIRPVRRLVARRERLLLRGRSELQERPSGGFQ